MVSCTGHDTGVDCPLTLSTLPHSQALPTTQPGIEATLQPAYHSGNKDAGVQRQEGISYDGSVYTNLRASLTHGVVGGYCSGYTRVNRSLDVMRRK